MEDLLMGAVPLIPTSVPLSSRKSAEPSGLNSAFSEHLSQWCRIGHSSGFESSTKWWPLKSVIMLPPDTTLDPAPGFRYGREQTAWNQRRQTEGEATSNLSRE